MGRPREPADVRRPCTACVPGRRLTRSARSQWACSGGRHLSFSVVRSLVSDFGGGGQGSLQLSQLPERINTSHGGWGLPAQLQPAYKGELGRRPTARLTLLRPPNRRKHQSQQHSTQRRNGREGEGEGEGGEGRTVRLDGLEPGDFLRNDSATRNNLPPPTTTVPTGE